VKHFELATDETSPGVTRRLETRLLVRDESGGAYGVTYRWRPDYSDADLLPANLAEDITIKTAGGERVQPWYFPTREDCRTCHTPTAGFVLGVKTRQLNRAITYPSGVTDNQLRAWNQVGLFDAKVPERELKDYPTLAQLNDATRRIEDRARSYLDANCAHCHRPGGTVANFDARFDTPLEQQNLIGGPVLLDQGIDGARVVAPNDIWRSILYLRASTVEAFRMPPLARHTVDEPGMALLRAWIESLPGPPVLPPPEISPRGDTFTKSVTVTLKSAPGAKIHYTTDGSVPSESDPLYEKPLTLTEPVILRARAFRAGYTESIATQEIFIVGE
jgi:mono/diheme cytochrome c family protein